MPKRTFWLVTGVAMGAGTSLWAERRLRRSVQQAAARLQPDALVAEMGRSARQAAENTGDRVKEALFSGREEMRRREDEIWAELAARGVEREYPEDVAVAPAPVHRNRPSRWSATGRATRGPATKLPLHLGK